MKKVTLLLIVVLSVIVWSCGGSSSEATPISEKSEKQEYFETLESYDLDTEEGMRGRLSDYYEITIPDQLSFVEINTKNGRKMTLVTEAITEEDLAQLNEWYKTECQRLIDDGYEETIIQDNTEMMGMIMNDASYMKKTDHSTPTEWDWNSISLYSNYDIAEKVYKLKIGFSD